MFAYPVIAGSFGGREAVWEILRAGGIGGGSGFCCCFITWKDFEWGDELSWDFFIDGFLGKSGCFCILLSDLI